MTAPTFTVDVAHNKHLARGTAEVDAIITVTATDADAGTSHAAVVIMLDTSASMFRPSKLAAARRAACAAIDALRDGTAFAVLAGTDHAEMVYPEERRLAVADDDTRADARQAIKGISAQGGTAMSRWLWLADELFSSSRCEVKHGILLTDGRNTSEPADDLAKALARLRGRFTCTCRGVGTDWEVRELRQIADALLGDVDIVAEPAELAADFCEIAARAMRKSVPDVALRLWTPQHSEVTELRQVDPSVADLTEHGQRSQQQAIDFPTGAWEQETRAYHARISMRPGGIGERMLVCRASIVGGGTQSKPGKVVVSWTDDSGRYGIIDPTVAHYTGQEELAEAIQDGLAARRDGDIETATGKLGRAVALANESGHAEASRLLSKVVDVEDAVTGKVHLKQKVSALDEMTLDTRSVVTSRMRPSGT
ncbi:MAG: VWA domain-containing protein [Actinophytocola sp.]|nr:VWA domain-containing protein [Actinophytocola sp.]